MKKILVPLIALAVSGQSEARKVSVTTSTEGTPWRISSIHLQSKAEHTPVLEIDKNSTGVRFKDWAMTFNELDWDSLQLLSRQQQDSLLHCFFSPDGDLRFTRGRISPGANDYARSWFSCDETPGDFELRHFNIERDKQAIIPFIRAAQKYNPAMTFWISPWSPPSWMKIHGDYPVVSSKYNNLSPKTDYLLFSGVGGDVDEDEMKLTGARDGVFPRQLATTDYLIQDPRYLNAYADYFCRFIDEYALQGIPIDMVMYQNEAYSYTPYPGCAWTAEGTIRFNRDYLAPALRKSHPDVKLYLGTFNTNRQDHVETILADKGLRDCIQGMGFQWEGREVLPEIRRQHPGWSYICSESECGWGAFDWKSAEHTFELINHYLGNGCDEYNIWNCILADNGKSPWGWKQNALVRVDSQNRTYTLTPEYHALRHYASFIPRGSEIIGYIPDGKEHIPVLAARTPNGHIIIVAGNFNDSPRQITVKINDRHLNATLQPHSFNTYDI